VAPYLTALLILGLVAVQSGLMPFASLGPAKPLLPLLAVVAWGLLRGPRAAVWWALGLGFLMDFASPGPFGLYTVPLLGAAAVTAVGKSRLAAGNILLPGIAAAAATLTFYVAQRALLAVLISRTAGRVDLTWHVAEIADELLPVLALNLLWMPVLYFPLRALGRRTAPPTIGWER
jgi:rod shape-determining protein MreD